MAEKRGMNERIQKLRELSVTTHRSGKSKNRNRFLQRK